jgi:soluble lytic murein transglycosylase-like protein
VLFLILGFFSIPVHAQIVSYVDDSGRRIFMNEESNFTVRKAKATSPRGFMGLGWAPSGSSATDQPLAPVALENRAKIDEMIREVSARYSVDPALIRAVVQTESNWNSSAISRRGALGLMQLVPTTAMQMGVNNAFDPKQNLDGGVHYLQTLLRRYNGDLDRSLAAYNAGPGAVDRAGGVPRFRETRDYVQRITSSYYRSGSERLPQAMATRRPIYRAVEADGRVVFTNE